MDDEKYMALAIELAKNGCGWVSPNPMVGAVIVRDGHVIGQGYHAKYGDLHAERSALKSCAQSPAGATMYVTLEPCCHQGKQPPCVDAILNAGISRVVIGSDDPSPLVSGRGIAKLREHGIDVCQHVLLDECNRLNDVFFHYIRTKRPFVVMKYAMTLDGKIAAYTGESKWITGTAAREHVHRQRHRYRGIMVGVGTVLKDDPMLTCRMEGGRNPIRIICDTHLRTPLDSNIVRTAKDIPTILATCYDDREQHAPYQAAGCEVLVLPKQEDHVDLPALLSALAAQGIDSILLEGGSTLNWSALQSGLVQKVQAYIAPKLLGGLSAKTPIYGLGFESPDGAVFLKNSNVTQLGEDFLIESEVAPHVHRHH